MIWTLTIPDFTPTPLNRLMRGKIKDRIKLSKSDRDVVSYYFRESGIPKANSRRMVSVSVTMGGTLMDPDAPLKSLFDSLKHCGAIKDDSAEFLEIGRVTIARGERMTEVTLEDLAP